MPRKIWESKSNQVRAFLKEQYRGCCQICRKTFLQRDGEPYFEGVYPVSRTRARWIDREGNVLCLCANCCAKFLHGEVVAETLLEQIAEFQPLKEGGGSSPGLEVILCGEATTIRFTERHLLDLQALVRLSAVVTSSELEGDGESLSRQ